ncbi:hypothetical protein [Rhizobium johnstonii]|uniref:hypothetical protein n=1 Tax=Rhizobium johnstonii TaxID=3019933 RepID=UPI003F99759E
MNRDNKLTRATANSSRDGGKAEEHRNLLDLPDGPLTNVAERLVTADPRDTARNLGSFKSVEKKARRAVQDVAPGQESDLSRFDRRNNQLGRLANDLAQGLTDGLALNSNDLAIFQVAAASDVGHFLGPEKQAALVDRIGEMDQMSQAASLLLLASNFNKFNDQNKSRIFEKAFELAAGAAGTSNIVARHPLYAMYYDLNANQQAQAGLLLNVHENMPRLQRAAEERTSNLDWHITSIETSVRDTVGAQISREQLWRGSEIARSISDAYDHAREDLMASSRSRDRTDSGR